ncbi:MAG: lactonase family protein [Gemmatimonadetes bacterium]|nr:lactonase family protein [Gemmatimonadota bacterium]
MGTSSDVLIRKGALFAVLAALVAGCSSDSSDPNGPADRDLTGERLYVTSGFTDEVLRIDPSDGSTVSRIPTERRRDEVDEPHAVVISPDRRHWYVTVAHGEPTLWKYETAGDRLVGRVTLPTAGAARIGITPDGTRAFVPDYDRSQPGVPSRVAVVDVADLSVVATPVVCGGPHHAQVNPAGEVVAIACSLSDEIVLLDVGTLEERGRFPAGPEAGPPGAPVLKPLNLDWSPDGETIWVGLHLADAVRAFRPDGEIVGTVATGTRPAQIALTADGGTLVIANRGDASLSLVNTELLAETARIPLGAAHPHGLALDDAGQRAFVSCEGTPQTSGRAVAVSLETRSVLWSAEAGAYTLGAAYTSAAVD